MKSKEQNLYNKLITKVISVCSVRDINIWEVNARQIIKNIKSEEYIVIVPDKDINIFRRKSPFDYKVYGESEYVGDLIDLLKSKTINDMHYRLGWYLQQFIKLAAIKKSKDNDLILIWDADTIPLKKLIFFDNSQKVYFYKGIEEIGLHRPYFKLISTLLGISRSVDFSFISQCFPVKGYWVREFFEHIEFKHGKSWIDAMVECIDFNKSTEFSEYETLVTFISNKYREDIVFTDGRCLREGSAGIGGIENINKFPYSLWLKKFDFVAFESWDKNRFVMKIFFREMIPVSILKFIKNTSTINKLQSILKIKQISKNQ